MSLLKDRYRNFSDFMEKNTKGVEVNAIENDIAAPAFSICIVFVLTLCLDWNLLRVWNITRSVLLQNSAGKKVVPFKLPMFLYTSTYINQLSSRSWPQISKFRKASDIPKHFIIQKIIQNGSIKAIEPNQSAGAILRVDHKPPLNLLFASKKTLPVKVIAEFVHSFTSVQYHFVIFPPLVQIFGIDLNGNGYSWLQSITLNQKIEFIPIKRHADYVECQVKMLQNPAHSTKVA